MLRQSTFNIISKIHNSENYFILNSLTGNADILSHSEAEDFKKNNINNPEIYFSKGYYSDEESEKELYKKKYLDFLDTRDNEEIQLFYVITYKCNFNCSYCYQDGYDKKKPDFNKDTIDSFFDYILKSFPGRKKYITLFGGEPLLYSENHIKQVEYFVHRSRKNNIDLSVVTNGYYLEKYIPLLKETNIREIQVTLDGTKEVHNKRRFIYKGKDTFEKISKGIDLALQHQLPVNLRMVIDKDNIEDLPNLARYAIKKGWTKTPIFKTQIGRNYELHYCQEGNTKLFSRIGLYKQIFELIKSYPEILEFHQPAFSLSRFLFENGKLPDPLFDACPGCKTEWAFDYRGFIYSCTATVGKPGEELGTFFPAIELNEKEIEVWEGRDVLSINKCKECNLQLACGGGCASIALNNAGQILDPDCRPIKKLLEMGLSLYFEKDLI